MKSPGGGWHGCGPACRDTRRGRCLGEEEFRQELLEAMSEPMECRYYGGAERRESEEAKAERILAEELKRRKWDRKAAQARRKGGVKRS